MQTKNQYLNYIIDSSFQEVDRLFVLSFEINTVLTRNTEYFHSKIEIKDYRAIMMIRSFLS